MTAKEEAHPLMTGRQLAQQGDVTAHVVRNYLRRGLLRAATHTDTLRGRVQRELGWHAREPEHLERIGLEDAR